MALIEIQLVRGAAKNKQRKALTALGLKRIGHNKWVPDTPGIRAKIKRVSHLIRINNDPAAPRQDRPAPQYDEEQDVAQIRRLAFEPNGITLERYSDAELKSGKTPDFKLLKGGKLCGLCEVKSPRDDYVFDAPNESGFAVRENVPLHGKLGSHIRQATKQFEAANPDHKLPNILVFVNHAPDLDRADLFAALSGIPVSGGRPLELLPAKMQRQVREAARRIDLFLWVDAKKGTCQHLSVAEAPHQAAALELLGLPKE
jgi:ribosomal protein L30